MPIERQIVGQIEPPVQGGQGRHLGGGGGGKMIGLAVEMDDVEIVLQPGHQIGLDQVGQGRFLAVGVKAQGLPTAFDQGGAGHRIAAGEQRHVFAQPDQFFGQIGNHPFGAAIEFGRNRLMQWGYHGDAHSTPSYLRHN